MCTAQANAQACGVKAPIVILARPEAGRSRPRQAEAAGNGRGGPTIL